MLAKVQCRLQAERCVFKVGHGSGSHLSRNRACEHNWYLELCQVWDVAGAPFGSVYLPAERPSGACSLWRTFGVQADLPSWAPVSLQTLMCSKGDSHLHSGG